MAKRRSSKSGERATAAIITAVISLIGAALAALISVLTRAQEKASESGRGTVVLTPSGRFSYEVVGESNYQDALESICGGRTEDGADKIVKAHLVLEDSNPHDDQAVRVDIEGKAVGYLSKINARKYRAYLRSSGHGNVTGVCDAKIVGGWDRDEDDRGSFGVKLNLSVR